MNFSGNICCSSVHVFLGETRITETLQGNAKPHYSYLIQSPAYVAWYLWGNSFSIKSCCSGTLFMFNYVLFINRKQWKQSAVQGTGAKLLMQSSWKFSSTLVLEIVFHIHIRILFKISREVFEPFLNLTSQKYLVPIIILDVAYNLSWYKALWKAISVFYFAIFCIFNYKAYLNVLTSSREDGKPVLQFVQPEVGHYLMQMWHQHPTWLGGGVRLQELRQNREINIHIEAAQPVYFSLG